MVGLIKKEIKTIVKSRKNKVLLIVLLAFLISINIFYREKQSNYADELEEEQTIDYNSAQIRLNNATTELDILEQALLDQDEYSNELLINQYGGLERVEEAKINLLNEIERNRNEGNYGTALLRLQKPLLSENREELENESQAIEGILSYKLSRLENIIEADEEGVVPQTALNLKGITMDDIHMRHIYYQHLADNNIEYNINPYTNTGVFSLSKLLDNYSMLFIFIIFTFIAIDLFLSEVEEGSYKIAYTQPYERIKIFFSKIIAITFLLVMIFILILSINLVVNTILNGSGDFSQPLVVSDSIGGITLSRENIEYIIISIGINILLSIALFLAVIFFTIGLISMVSVFTDSTAKTIGIVSGMILISLLFREFMSPNSLIHTLSPLNYIFVQDVLVQRYNSSLILGILLNLGLGIIFLLLSLSKFTKKDFLGARS